MIGRLLSLGPIELDKFTLTKQALELVDKEFTQVDIFSLLVFEKSCFF